MLSSPRDLDNEQPEQFRRKQPPSQFFDVPFHASGCAEPQPAFKSYVMANHGSDIEHFHERMSDQIASSPCILHPAGTGCQAIAHDVGLLVMGTPCNPFSKQRTKRGRTGEMREHWAYDITFQDSLALLRTAQPKAAVLEQVPGFGQPEDADDWEADSSPYDRPGSFEVSCHVGSPESLY